MSNIEKFRSYRPATERVQVTRNTCDQTIFRRFHYLFIYVFLFIIYLYYLFTRHDMDKVKKKQQTTNWRTDRPSSGTCKVAQKYKI